MMRYPATHRIGQRLSREDQATLDELVTTHGEGGAARRLGVTRDAVNRLVHGGTATAERTDVMARKLAAWRAAS